MGRSCSVFSQYFIPKGKIARSNSNVILALFSATFLYCDFLLKVVRHVGVWIPAIRLLHMI